MSKTVEREELIGVLRKGGRLLDSDNRKLGEAIRLFQDEWGAEIMYAEVDDVLYKIAPVD